jgi:osmotically-inducible protein OsmY
VKTLFVLVIGAAIGIAAYIYWKHPERRPEIDKAGEQISEGAGEIKGKLSQTFTNLDTEQIKAEMERTGRVVRKKAEEAGAKISDVTSDARITGEIKGKFAVDSDLSAFKMSVNTTDGIVTLSGSAPSHEVIKKAMRVVLDTQGVKQVISTVQVKQ